MDLEREKTYAFDRGMEQKAVEDARNFLNEGIAPEVISRCTGLPLDQVLELQKELTPAQ